MPDFAARLARLGLSQAELRRWVEYATGRKLARSTTARWVNGERVPDPTTDALLAVIERPELLQNLHKAP